MPRVKVKRILSVSSEDPNYPATNLLNTEVHKKWKCKSVGEQNAVVVMQLEEPTTITAVDIGNEHSAFIEVLVGKSSCPDKYEVLVLMSSFMSPLESRNSTCTNRVRMFSTELVQKVAREKWDLVKVVCTQQYNKFVQYGLSFLTLHSGTGSGQEEPNKIGRFALKTEPDVSVEDPIAVGSFFARFKHQVGDEPLKGAAAIREASKTGIVTPAKLLGKVSKNGGVSNGVNKEETKATESKKRERLQSPKTSERNIDSPVERFKWGTDIADTSPTATVPKHANRISPDKTPSKKMNAPAKKRSPATTARTASSDTPKKAKLAKPSASIVQSAPKLPFNRLLSGVVFCISGYQNPGRDMVRRKALEMGAKYRPDWDATCTHLLCAFANTPKHQQVRGKGHVVTKEWVEECYVRRKRIPWRRFALDKSDKQQPDSEPEIEEDLGQENQRSRSPPAQQREERVAHYESDTDTEEEIERIKQAMSASKTKVEPEDKDNAYTCSTEVDTDDDSEQGEKTFEEVLSSHSDVFEGKTFYIDTKEKALAQNLKRHIMACKGDVPSEPDESVQFVVTEKSKKEEWERRQPDLTVVQPKWVWRCIKQKKLLI